MSAWPFQSYNKSSNPRISIEQNVRGPNKYQHVHDYVRSKNPVPREALHLKQSSSEMPELGVTPESFISMES